MNLEKNTPTFYKNLTTLELKDRLSDYNERIAKKIKSKFTEK